MNVNKAIVVGRITSELELRATPNGNHVLQFSVATNHVWKDKQGNKQEKATFHNVVAWGKQAENIQKYFVKGQEIYCEGRLETESWEDKDSGKKMYRTQIVLERFDFGQKPKGAEDNQDRTASPDDFNQDAKDFDNGNYPTGEDEEINVDDIPF